ncbi:carbohydrate-binding protein [Cellulosimicrobium sp. Marseille-Q8652]
MAPRRRTRGRAYARSGGPRGRGRPRAGRGRPRARAARTRPSPRTPPTPQTPQTPPTPRTRPTGLAPWSAAAVYTGGATVTYQGQSYRAKWWTQNDVPGAAPYGPWEPQGTC